MVEIRIHGRGGQGSVVASKILAVAFFRDGYYVQSFPSFGVERRGAPVTAFIRVDKEFIYLRSNIYKPDHLIILDHNLLADKEILSGLKANGWIIINSPYDIGTYSDIKDYRVATVNANIIALNHSLGSHTFPIVNSAILGAFSKATSLVNMKSIEEAILEEFPLNKSDNIKSAWDAFNSVKFKD